ncbi:low-complexity tail membrane protein [Lusitaniella coriacea]|uniref:low-complexity tail membrane protein n=1 Tax=Lusitaniella coriacea TaxID=1983105 RepID=UPI003CED786C
MSFRSEPFLWIHLAGLAVLPLFLELTWLGLAIAESLVPVWLELILLAIVGIVPIAWMQWQKPFDIFSLLFVALQPQQLTSQQRQILRLFKTRKHRVLTLFAVLAMGWALWKLAVFAPLAAPAAARLTQSRGLGLGLAIVGFLGSNLFLQVPISVLGVLLTSNGQFEATEPLTPEEVSQSVTVLGFRVGNILPTVASNNL